MRLAGEADVEAHQVSNWERGEKLPTLPSLLKLCRPLQTTLDELCPVEAQELATRAESNG